MRAIRTCGNGVAVGACRQPYVRAWAILLDGCEYKMGGDSSKHPFDSSSVIIFAESVVLDDMRQIRVVWDTVVSLDVHFAVCRVVVFSLCRALWGVHGCALTPSPR